MTRFTLSNAPTFTHRTRVIKDWKIRMSRHRILQEMPWKHNSDSILGIVNNKQTITNPSTSRAKVCRLLRSPSLSESLLHLSIDIPRLEEARPCRATLDLQTGILLAPHNKFDPAYLRHYTSNT